MKLLNSKKGMMMNGFPKIINFIMAILCIGVGGTGIFGELIGFTLPVLPSIIFYGLAALSGLILILDGALGSNGLFGSTMQIMPRSINILIGLLVAAGGTILLLGAIGKMTSFPVPPVALNALLLAGGAILLLDAILGVKTY